VPCEPSVHGLIGPLHEAIGTDGDDRVLHAVEQGFELALAGLDGGETFFERRAVLSMAPATRPISSWRRFLDASLEIALGNAGGDIDDAFEAASAPLGSGRGHNQREKNVMPERVRACGGPARRRLGHRRADRPGGRLRRRRARQYKGTECQGGAAAFIAADFAFERSDEFRTRRMVFMPAGFDSESARDFARGIDDGERAPADWPSCAAMSARE